MWREVKPTFVAELHRYDFAKMRQHLTDLWTYLRMERSDPFILVNVPDLLERHYSAQGAQYERYDFQVESAGAHDYGLNVHEYLHSIVNPLVKRHLDAHAAKLRAHFEAGREGPYARIDQITEAGLAMTAPFYLLVSSFEDAGRSFDAYLSDLLAALPERHAP